MQQPGEYDKIPFESRLLLLCNDALIILAVESGGSPRHARGEETVEELADQSFSLVDVVSWKGAAQGGAPGASISGNVAENLFSVAHLRTHTLHTFRVNAATDKKKWLDALTQAQHDFLEQEKLHEKQEKDVLDQLTGLSFQITGTVKVQSTVEKPFMVYMIQMKNEKGTLTILKRYRQMLALHKKLVQLYGEDALSKFPPKKLIGNTDERFIQKRSHELSLWLDGMVKLKDVLKVPEVRQFLTTTVSAKNEDELLPNFAGPSGEEERARILETIASADDSDSDDDHHSSSGIESSSGSVPQVSPKSDAKAAQVSVPALPSMATALYSYSGAEPGSLKFKKGDSFVVERTPTDSGPWVWCRRADGLEGWVPRSYISEDSAALTSPPLSTGLEKMEL